MLNFMQTIIPIPEEVYKAKSETGQTLEEFLESVEGGDLWCAVDQVVVAAAEVGQMLAFSKSNLK